jgi:tubulysin polyketide synthase-like protein
VNTVAEFIEELQSKGIRLHPRTGVLRIDAPRGALSHNLKTILAERKLEILAFLQVRTEESQLNSLELAGELLHLFNERASILEDELQFSRAEAERIAMLETRSTQRFKQWQESTSLR